jgi:hypothetical protein
MTWILQLHRVSLGSAGFFPELGSVLTLFCLFGETSRAARQQCLARLPECCQASCGRVTGRNACHAATQRARLLLLVAHVLPAWYLLPWLQLLALLGRRAWRGTVRRKRDVDLERRFDTKRARSTLTVAHVSRCAMPG